MMLLVSFLAFKSLLTNFAQFYFCLHAWCISQDRRPLVIATQTSIHFTWTQLTGGQQETLLGSASSSIWTTHWPWPRLRTQLPLRTATTCFSMVRPSVPPNSPRARPPLIRLWRPRGQSQFSARTANGRKPEQRWMCWGRDWSRPTNPCPSRCLTL